MCPKSIPIRFTLADACVVALLEAADNLENAHDSAAFLDALDGNRRLWLAINDLAMNNWPGVSLQDADYALRQPACGRRAVSDNVVAAFIGIDRRTAARLAGPKETNALRARLRLVCDERGGADFMAWLLSEIRMKSRIETVLSSAG